MSGAALERRAREQLARPGAWLDRSGEAWLVRVGADRRRRPLLRLDEATLRALRREPGLAARAEGGWILAGQAAAEPGRLAGEVVRIDPDGRERRLNANRGESPIAWLARRKGRDGRPWLGKAEVMAAERLREDFEKAGLIGRLTMDWTAGPRDRTPRGPAAAVAGGQARRRLRRALDAVGPGLAEMLSEVCLYGSAIQSAERSLGLPAQTGKLRLRLALERLAAHYRLS